MKRFFAIGFTIIVFFVCQNSAYSIDCPPNKVGVTIINPAGRAIEICVAPEAISHIGGDNDIVIPATCPCYNADDLVSIFDDQAICLDEINPSSRSVQIRWAGIKIPFAATREIFYDYRSCGYNFGGGPYSFDLTEDEVEACIAMIYSSAEELGIECIVDEE